MKKEKTDILRRKMIKSGLAALAVAGVTGAVMAPKSNAQNPPQCNATCYACPDGCQSCASCQSCQPGNSKGEPEE